MVTAPYSLTYSMSGALAEVRHGALDLGHFRLAQRRNSLRCFGARFWKAMYILARLVACWKPGSFSPRPVWEVVPDPYLGLRAPV
jgi:hypothetical protein